MWRSRRWVMRLLVMVIMLAGLAGVAGPSVAMPANPADDQMRVMSISHVLVSAGAEDNEIAAGGTTTIYIEVGVLLTPGEVNTVVVNISESSGRVAFGNLVCNACSGTDPAPTFTVDGDDIYFEGAVSVEVTAPAGAVAGESFTVNVSATDQPRNDTASNAVTLTVVAPSPPTPLPTIPPTAISTAVPSNTPAPPTATAPAPTSTTTAPNPTATSPGTNPTPTVPGGGTSPTAPPAGDDDAHVRIRVRSADPDDVNQLPAGSLLRVRQSGSNVYSVNIGQAGGAPIQLPLGPVSLNTSGEPADFGYGEYTVTLDAGAAYEPFAQNFTLNSPIETLEIVLTPDLGEGESLVDIAITSSDPTAINRMGNDTTIWLTQGERVEFSGTLTDPATYSLPRTLSFTNPIDFGVYTLTINAGANFEVYTAQIVIEQAPEQIVSVVLQVDDAGGLVEALVAKLKEILAEILAGNS